MKNNILFLLILVAVAVGGYWFLTMEQEPRFVGPVERLTVAEGQQPVFALLYIAEEQGYFEQFGLEVEFKQFTSGRDALQSAIDGETDIATVYETPVVLQTFAGEDIAIISSLHESTRNTALVARRDKGIVEPSDLVGKRIAVTQGTNGEFFLQQFLISQGISLNDVEFVSTSPGDMVNVFVSGDVDAVATWNTHLYNAQQSLPANQVTSFYSDIYTEFSVLAGRREVIDKRSEAMRRLMRSLVHAEEFLAENKEVSIETVVGRLQNLAPETTRAVWDDAIHRAHLGNVMLAILTQEAEWLRDIGRVHGDIPDFRTLFVTEFLQDIQPSAVTVL